MTIAYWIVADITALLLIAGGMKLLRLKWVEDFSQSSVKLIGAAVRPGTVTGRSAALFR